MENNYLEQIRNAADSPIIVSCIVTIACMTHSRQNCEKSFKPRFRASETRKYVNCDINAFDNCWVNHLLLLYVAHLKFHLNQSEVRLIWCWILITWRRCLFSTVRCCIPHPTRRSIRPIHLLIAYSASTVSDVFQSIYKPIDTDIDSY